MQDNHIYDLTEEEYKECLAMAEIAIFGRCEKSEKPKSIFAVAQPGAGKTALRAYLVNEAQNAGTFAKFIEFNPDEVAIHHKHYREIMRDFPDDAFKILKRFTYNALDYYLRQRAVELRCNIMQEGTFATTDGYLGIIDFQKNGGKLQGKDIKGDYDVDINILAVNKYESLLSSFEREQYFVENGLPPRAVTIENHDYSYNKMLETVDIVEKRKLYDQMRVFRRGYIKEKPELVYIAGDNRFESVKAAILYERKIQEDELLKNPSLYINRIEILKQKLKENKNESLENRLGTLEKIFNDRLNEYREEENVLL